MNRAIKYFREHGLEKSKKHLLDIREAVNQVSWVHSLEGFSQDLKRLVESHNVVSQYQSLDAAKERLQYFINWLAEHWTHAEFAPEIAKFKQAIADVEACKEVS